MLVLALLAGFALPVRAGIGVDNRQHVRGLQSGADLRSLAGGKAVPGQPPAGLQVPDKNAVVHNYRHTQAQARCDLLRGSRRPGCGIGEADALVRQLVDRTDGKRRQGLVAAQERSVQIG